jgi:hypothetical protein
MRTLVVTENGITCAYNISNPEERSETEFEFAVARAVPRVYSEYDCVVFNGGFRFDDQVFRPDLALIARDRSHWFVVEVELVSHSLDHHVLPQVRAFRYGDPEPECVGILARELRIENAQARTMLDCLPRGVAVVANKRIEEWAVALRALRVQLLTVSVFRSPEGSEAVEVDGVLEVVSKSLGFGLYSAVDRSLVFRKSVDLPRGRIQISDSSGAPSAWTVSDQADHAWITKEIGVPDLIQGTFVQLIRTVDGRISMRQPD